MPALAYYNRKAPNESPGLSSLPDGRIANSTYTFRAYALRRSLGFNPDEFETETKD